MSTPSLFDLTGRVALITGGTGHIGFAIASALAAAGATIVLVDLKESQDDRTIARLMTEHGGDGAAYAIDCTDDAAVHTLIGRVEQRFGRLDVLVHSAALVGTSALSGWTVPFAEQSAATFRKALEVNCASVFTMTQACTPLLTASGHGSVIAIGSIYGIVGPVMGLYEGTVLGNPAGYAASKGGLLQFMRWLAPVLAPSVRANTITLGGVFRGHTDPFLSRYVARTPLGRMATEADAQGAALYLASDASSYVTGQNLVVDGGWTAI